MIFLFKMIYVLIKNKIQDKSYLTKNKKSDHNSQKDFNSPQTAEVAMQRPKAVLILFLFV